MSARKHTPGPWWVSKTRRNLVVALRNGRIASIASCLFTHSRHGSASLPTVEECSANLQLVATGPELLDAAEEARAVLSELYAKYQTKIGPFASQAQRVNVLLGAVIAKATGDAA